MNPGVDPGPNLDGNPGGNPGGKPGRNLGGNLGRGRLVTAVVAWLAGAATAVAVGLYALSAIDFGLASHPASQPLGQPLPQDISATAADDPGENPASPPPAVKAARPSASSSTTTAPPSPDVQRTITSPGGTVLASCTGASAYLVSWSPAQGFHTDEVRRGPGPYAQASFDNGLGQQYTITVHCVGGIPQGFTSHDT